MAETKKQTVINDEDSQGQKDQYCYICEDGGDIIECSFCWKACCYNVIGHRSSNPGEEPEACVSIPESMATGGDIPFPCPSCVAEQGMTSIGYFINQGARVTLRVAPRASVALVIYHLYSYKAVALALADQVTAALSAFYVTVACQTRLIHRGFTSEEADIMFDEFPEGPYHLAVIFLTEGDPQGGWWHTSAYGNMKDGQVSEHDFLETCLSNLQNMASTAASARVFGVACGFNLRLGGSIDSILAYFKPTAFSSLVLPSTCSLLMSDYLPMFPEWFINLYYFGAALEPSLLRIWAKSKEIRTHTGLVIFNRTDPGSDMSAKMVLYAPVASRPFGVQLPLVHTVCGCTERRGKWDFKTEVQNNMEVIFVYRNTCCGVELQVGVYPDQRRQRLDYEVRFVVEPWDINKRRFTFNESDNVSMKVLPASTNKKGGRLDLNGMWTRRGMKALKREMSHKKENVT